MRDEVDETIYPETIEAMEKLKALINLSPDELKKKVDELCGCEEVAEK